MKVLTGFFNAESNAYVDKECGITDFDFLYGDDMIEEMKTKEIFEENDIALIPSIYANGYAQGVVTKEAFDLIADTILRTVKDNINDIDGIFLFLHGGSYVKNLEGNSGEHYILREIRKITGPFMPIAVVMDPHGNISKEYVESCTIVRSYRESPHIDIDETYEQVARLLIDHLKNRKQITPVFKRIPIMLGGERCVSTDEPLLSINKKLNEMEKSKKVMSISYHIGYVRHDNYTCGAAVVVIPSDNEHRKYAESVAEDIADYVFSRRREFKFTGNALDPDEALVTAIEYKGKPVFITDSGDNTTAGASGQSTFILQQLLELKEFNHKNILISAITDPEVVSDLSKLNIGDSAETCLGKSLRSSSNAVHITGEIITKGKVRNLKIFGSADEDVGDTVMLRVKDMPIDIVLSNRFVSFAEIHQFEKANIDLSKYDIVIVKQGYIFPEIGEISELSIMSLTPGETYQYTEKLNYKKILRPMFPIDDI
jgi:microcystin degradation protein MlrC